MVTPVGNNVETFWNNIINGVCGIDFIKSIPTDNLSVKIAGEVKDFNPKEYGIDAKAARKHDKFCLYALAAASQAMAQSGLKSTDEPSDDPNHIAPERLGVYIGSGIGGMHSFVNETSKMINEGPQWISPLFIPTMISNIGAGNVAIAHNAKGVCLPVVTACATGTHSIGEAYRAIKHGYADAIIAGVTKPNSKYTHLFYGYTRQNKDLMLALFMNSFETLVLESNENTVIDIDLEVEEAVFLGLTSVTAF